MAYGRRQQRRIGVLQALELRRLERGAPDHPGRPFFCFSAMRRRALANAALAWHYIRMPKASKRPKRPTDADALNDHLINLSTHSSVDDIRPPTRAQISLLMAELGRKGGKKGGKRRLETMTPKERSTAARKAAQARWSEK